MIKRHPSLIPAHPGEILREDVLPAVSMTKTAVARALGISRQTLYDIINEKQPVTAEMAVRFGKLFGNGAAFWLNLQRAHDLVIAERTVDVSGIPTLETRPVKRVTPAGRLRRSRRGISNVLAAVDVQLAAGDVGGGVRAEEIDRGRHF